ncbi:MAG: circadian clock protein KaiC [Ignavibacteriales bacterium]|nr:circadian clock protein KaiC [Ignavibacteriales bacterium]
MKKNEELTEPKVLTKVLTGIQGLDEVTGGGLPKGRPTLVCGNAGCGKTLFAMEFLVHGAVLYNEPGVFMAFEETETELTTNVASLGFDLDKLVAEKKIVLDHVHIERSEIEETGEYDLEGLFIRLNHAIDSIGAKRVVLDTIESLFAGLPNPLILRAELRRLFRWLKVKGVTAIITGERGDGDLTRHGLEEYVSDCVIVLDHRVTEQTSVRRLRVVKYRGSVHGTNEYPFLIDASGFSVLPITSIGLAHIVSSERISTGVPRLDTMLSIEGYYRGSSVLVSGTAGTGKSSLASHFSLAACKRGERVLYFALEESADQIMRNMLSIGIDLKPWVEKGLLKFHAKRVTFYGLEAYLTVMHKEVNDFKPQVVILDPISSFIIGTNVIEAKAMIMRMIDFLKFNNITAFMTSLTSGSTDLEHTEINMSSLIDTWLLLRDIEIGGERNRGMYILKSRGMAHSNQIREFILTDHGAELLDVYVGQEGVLTGTARVAQEAKEKSNQLLRNQEIELKRRELVRKRKALEAQIALLQVEFEADEAEALKVIGFEEDRNNLLAQDENEMAKSRKADVDVKTEN